jgi:Tfp pilus assembly protein PilF
LSLDCYFDRAIRYRPDDTVVRSIYAMFLNKKSRKDEAMRQLELAMPYANENPVSLHTIGTVYLELGEFDRALTQAHKARSMGLEWPALENALKAAGHWKEPAQ